MDTFELKYKITDSELKSINKRYLLFYFVLYLAVALVGIAIGIVAVVLNPQKLMFVLGIILLVLGAILLVCALLLLISPKNFLASAVRTGDDELTVKVNESGITVERAGEEIQSFTFAHVINTKVKKDLLYVYVGKDVALLMKNAIVSGQSFEELCKFIYARTGGLTNPVLADKAQESSATDGGETDNSENAKVGGESEKDGGEQNAEGEGGNAESD